MREQDAQTRALNPLEAQHGVIDIEQYPVEKQLQSSQIQATVLTKDGETSMSVEEAHDVDTQTEQPAAKEQSKLQK